MFKKSLLITALFILMTMPALCETIQLNISVTVPKLPGLNYFPEEADVMSPEGADEVKTIVMQEKALRNGKAVTLKTSIIK